MYATQISTNTRKYVIFGKSFYIQTPELVNPKLADIKGFLVNFLFKILLCMDSISKSISVLKRRIIISQKVLFELFFFYFQVTKGNVKLPNKDALLSFTIKQSSLLDEN
jgi:hypothetical protein